MTSTAPPISDMKWAIDILRARGLNAEETQHMLSTDHYLLERLRPDIEAAKAKALQEAIDVGHAQWRNSPEGRLAAAKQLKSDQEKEQQLREDAVLLLSVEQGLDPDMLRDQTTQMLVEAAGLQLSERPELQDPNDWEANVAALERSNAVKKMGKP